MAENLLDTVYLPEIDKKNFYEGKPYQLLKENNNDTSQLEGYQEKSQAPLEFEDLSTYTDKEEWIAKHAGPDVQKEFFSALGDFVLDLGKDGIRSLAVGATNGVDFAVNLAPTLTKLYDLAPVPFGGGGVLEATGVQEDIVAKATKASDQLEDAREFLKNFKDDGNVVSKLVQVMGQDLMYSMPMYKKLKSVGIPTVPAFVISGGVGGAIGIEKKLKFTGDDKEQYNSTFTQDFFGKDIAEFKRLVGILPNTPYDEIADEVTQALEYGAFSYAIPKVIDGLKFMKNNIPYFAGGAAVATIPGDAEANPLKSIVNAVKNAPVFKSAVVDATTKLPNKASGEQIFKTISNTPGVKQSELKWMDLEAFLKDKKNITKDEVLEFISANRIDVTEVMFPRTGKDFGMYDEMLESAELRQTRLFNEYFEEKGIPLDSDNYTFFNTLENGTKIPEKMDFSRFQRTDISDTLDSFKDVNTKIYDTDAILKTFPHKSNPNLATFYLFEDSASGQIKIFRNIDIEGDPVKYTVDNPNSGGTFKYNYQADLTVNDIKKYAAEAEVRELKRLKSLQEGTTRYETYTEPGGEDYKELILKYRQLGELGGRKPIPLETGVTKYDNIDNFDIAESPHFNEPNELANVRFKTREIPGPRAGVKEGSLKVLSVEEMQSDLVQAVKQSNKDFIEDATPNIDGEVENMDAMDNIIKDFPFKNNWYELTLKRLIRYAADNGFDAISIPKGSVIQDRYGLTRRIDDFNITYFDEMRKEVGLMARDQNGTTQIDEIYTFDRIKEEFGEDVLNRVLKKGPRISDDADKIAADYKTIIDGTDEYPNIKLAKQIEIGGEGKTQLYNKTIPAFLKKYGKKWNAKIYDDSLEALPSPSMPVTVFEITPEMKQSVQSTSQPLFELFGGVSIGTLASQAVSDNIENNIISQSTENMY